MAHPIDEILNPTKEQLYDELYLDYFFAKTKAAFPSILSGITQYQILIRLMAWAVARSYQQPLILKYLYDPELVLDVLLPKLADTLEFSYPLEYDLEHLRLLIKYLQKIRRTRGTWNSVKQLLRLLEVSEEDVLAYTFYDYNTIQVEEQWPGFVLIGYNKINDWDFANSMLEMVMPAGYAWRLESSTDTKGLTTVYRHRVDFIESKEVVHTLAYQPFKDVFKSKSFVTISKTYLAYNGALVSIVETSKTGFNSNGAPPKDKYYNDQGKFIEPNLGNISNPKLSSDYIYKA